MVILKSVCARVCVCDMGKKGKGLRKQSWDDLVTFPFFFFSLPLFELEIKDTTDTIKGPTIYLEKEGGLGFCSESEIVFLLFLCDPTDYFF